MKSNHAKILVAVMAFLVFTTLSTQLHSQEPPAAGAAPAAGAPAGHGAHHDKTLWDYIKEGGFMMIPLGLTSVVMFALMGDSLMRLRNSQLAPPELVSQLQAQFQTGDYNAAFHTCKSKPSFVSNVVMAGLSMLGHGKAAAERAMEDALSREVAVRNTRIRYLSVIGVVTPMMGLTGTVLGMIRAFSTLGSSGIGDPSALAGAIGEVLVATLSGLGVAIPSFFAYYVFGNRIMATSAYAEDVVNGLFRGMPYHQFDGLIIGDDPIYAAPPHPSLLATRVGGATGAVVQCPTCQAPVTEGTPVCPSCNSPLNWAA